MRTSSPQLDLAAARSLPASCGCMPLLPAPSAMRLDDWSALLGAVTERLQRLADDGDAAPFAPSGEPAPLQDCIDALRQLQRNLHADNR